MAIHLPHAWGEPSEHALEGEGDESLTLVCHAEREVFTFKALDGFQRGTGDVGTCLHCDGDHQILVLQENVHRIAVVAAGPGAQWHGERSRQ